MEFQEILYQYSLSKNDNMAATKQRTSNQASCKDVTGNVKKMYLFQLFILKSVRNKQLTGFRRTSV